MSEHPRVPVERVTSTYAVGAWKDLVLWVVDGQTPLDELERLRVRVVGDGRARRGARAPAHRAFDHAVTLWPGRHEDRRRAILPLVRAALCVWVGALLAAGSAAAQPAHCERALERTPWPAIGDPIDTVDPAPVTPAEARRAVAAFRRAWRAVRHGDAVLRSLGECWSSSSEHFVVRRVSADHVRRTLADTRVADLVGGSSRDAGDGWVWEVYWGGASRRHPPSGAVSAYFTPDLGTLIAAIHWREG